MCAYFAIRNSRREASYAPDGGCAQRATIGRAFD
jgi:hypothetical protein